MIKKENDIYKQGKVWFHNRYPRSFWYKCFQSEIWIKDCKLVVTQASHTKWPSDCTVNSSLNKILTWLKEGRLKGRSPLLNKRSEQVTKCKHKNKLYTAIRGRITAPALHKSQAYNFKTLLAVELFRWNHLTMPHNINIFLAYLTKSHLERSIYHLNLVNKHNFIKRNLLPTFENVGLQTSQCNKKKNV